MSDSRPEGNEPAAPETEAAGTARREPAGIEVFRVPVYGMFLIAVVTALYYASEFLIPVVMAFLLALILSPVVRGLRRRGLPEGVSAVVIAFALAAAVTAATFTLSTPVAEWIRDAPSVGSIVRHKLHDLREPLEAIQEASRNVEEATKSATKEPGVQEVVVRKPGLLSWAASGAPEIIAGAGIGFFLLIFLLASGELFYEKLIRAMPRLEDKKRWLRIVKDVERDVSRYLLTVTLINTGLGLAIGTGLFFAGLPEPFMWGLAAGLLNFIPYLGATLGVAAVTVAGIVAMPTLGAALVPPAIYAACNIFEGQVVTPALLGRRLQINAVVTFLAIAFWGWLWGALGVFVAVPILIVIRTFAHHADGLTGIELFLSARDHGEPVTAFASTDSRAAAERMRSS